MTAALLGWGVLALTAVYATGLVRAAHRAAQRAGRSATRPDAGGAPGADGADRAGLLRRAVATTTALVAARALGPGEDLVTLLWGLLVAAWAWGLITAATAWRRLPWRGGGGPGQRRTTVDLTAEVALLVLVVAVLVP